LDFRTQTKNNYGAFNIKLLMLKLIVTQDTIFCKHFVRVLPPNPNQLTLNVFSVLYRVYTRLRQVPMHTQPGVGESKSERDRTSSFSLVFRDKQTLCTVLSCTARSGRSNYHPRHVVAKRPTLSDLSNVPSEAPVMSATRISEVSDFISTSQQSI